MPSKSLSPNLVRRRPLLGTAPPTPSAPFSARRPICHDNCRDTALVPLSLIRTLLEVRNSDVLLHRKTKQIRRQLNSKLMLLAVRRMPCIYIGQAFRRHNQLRPAASFTVLLPCPPSDEGHSRHPVFGNQPAFFDSWGLTPAIAISFQEPPRYVPK